MAQFTRERLQRESRNRDKRNLDPFEYVADSGEVFRFKHPQQLSLDEMEAFGKGTVSQSLAALVGDEAYPRLKAQPEVDGFLLEDLFQAYNAHYGFDQGE